MSLVIDASVGCKWLVAEEDSPRAAAFLESQESLIAPELIVLEVANALWRKLRSGEVTSGQATIALETLPGFFDELVPGVSLASRSLVIAESLGHPVYDCFYVALAESRASRLVTADKGLYKAVARTRWQKLVMLM